MVQTVTLAQVLRDGIVLTADEAIAVAQKLVHDRHPVSGGPPFGPPTCDTVLIDESGAVLCPTCEATPAVSELAILLEALLPHGTRAPGAVRYTIARALLNVEAPPFDSVHDFSRALGRFEQSDRQALIRKLFARWRARATEHTAAVIPFKAAAPAGSRIERRHPIPPPIASELRRELRKADLERYRVHSEAARQEWRRASRRTRTAAGIAAGLVLIATGEIMHRRNTIRDSAAPPQRTNLTPASRQGPDASAPDKLSTAAADARRVPAGGSAIVAPPHSRAAQPRPSRRNVVAAPVQAAPPAPDRDRAVPKSRAQGGGRAQDASSRETLAAAVEPGGTAMFVPTATPSQPGMLRGAGEELQVLTIADNKARNLHVQPSPDGSSIAFDSDRDGERGVYLADRDGSHVRRISGPGYAAMPSWSPDSRQLAYVRHDRDPRSGSNLSLLVVGSGEERPLTRYGSGQTSAASWFPDGRRIAYAHEGALVILDVQTGRTRQFQSPIAGRGLGMPAVSPDSRRVIFHVAQQGAWLVDLQDGSMRCALTDPTAEQFAWMSDGRRFAFFSRRTGEWGVWVMAPIKDADGLPEPPASDSLLAPSPGRGRAPVSGSRDVEDERGSPAFAGGGVARTAAMPVPSAAHLVYPRIPSGLH